MKTNKIIQLVIASIFLICLHFSIFSINRSSWILSNEDVYQIQKGMENIVSFWNIKNKDIIWIEWFKTGASFTFFDGEGRSIASKLPTTIFTYTILLLIPGFSFFYFINIILGFVLLWIYVLIFRKNGHKNGSWFFIFLATNGLFLSHTYHLFETFLFWIPLVLWFYYLYFEKNKIGFLFIAFTQIVRPEYWLISLIISLKELILKKKITYLLICLFCMSAVIGINYKLTGQINFLNSGFAQKDPLSWMRVEVSIFTTIWHWVFADWKLNFIIKHLIFIWKDLLFLSPLLIFFIPSLFSWKILNKSTLQMQLWLLLCVILFYSNRSNYYGYLERNYYSSFMRYTLPGLFYFILVWMLIFLKNKNVFYKILCIVLLTCYSFINYISWKDIKYSLPNKILVTAAQVKYEKNISAIIPKNSLILSDWTMDKFLVFSDRINIVQISGYSEFEIEDRLNEFFSLRKYFDKEIYIVLSALKKSNIEELLKKVNIPHDLLYKDRLYSIYKING